MIIATPVTPDGQVDPRWGKAPRVAITEIEDGVIERWDEHEVGWDVLHDEGAHGTHHARIVKFLRENNVDAVIIARCGASSDCSPTPVLPWSKARRSSWITLTLSF